MMLRDPATPNWLAPRRVKLLAILRAGVNRLGWRARQAINWPSSQGDGNLFFAALDGDINSGLSAHCRWHWATVWVAKGPEPMLKIAIDNAANIFPGAVTIADLARFSFNGEDSDALHIYRAQDIIDRDWLFELANLELEYATGISATFKDGSKLHVGAWADCCDGSGCKYCVA
jgi:hypothetical protein